MDGWTRLTAVHGVSKAYNKLKMTVREAEDRMVLDCAESNDASGLATDSSMIAALMQHMDLYDHEGDFKMQDDPPVRPITSGYPVRDADMQDRHSHMGTGYTSAGSCGPRRSIFRCSARATTS